MSNSPADGTYSLLSYGSGTDPFSALSLPSRVFTLSDSSGYVAITVNNTTTPHPIWTGLASGDWSYASEPGSKELDAERRRRADGFPSWRQCRLRRLGRLIGHHERDHQQRKRLAVVGHLQQQHLCLHAVGQQRHRQRRSHHGRLRLGDHIEQQQLPPAQSNLNGGTVSVAAIGLSGANGPLGAGSIINIAGGSLLYTGGGESNNRNVAFNSAGTFNISNSAAALTLSGAVSGTGAILKNGPGQLTLAGSSNSYSGGLTISQGSLSLSYAPAANSSYPWLANGITLGDANTGASAAQLILGAGINTTDATVAGVGVRQLGTITVNPLSSGTATINLTAPTVSEDFALALNGPVLLTGAHNQVTAPVRGSGAGAGNTSKFINPGSGNTLVWTADGTASTFLGNVEVMSGKWQTQNNAYVANDAAHQNLVLPATASVQVDAGATWSILHGEQTIDNLNGSGSVTFGGGNFLGSQLVVGGNNNTGGGSFNGTLSAITVGKTGTGTQEFVGSGITYTGATTLTNGTLKLTVTRHRLGHCRHHVQHFNKQCAHIDAQCLSRER